MSRIKKSNSTTFVKLMTEKILSFGGKIISQTKDLTIMSLDTKFGDLGISLYDDNVHCYTVFARFKDVERAKNGRIGCNPFSGKYNIHVSPIDLNCALDIAISHIETVLLKKS